MPYLDLNFEKESRGSISFVIIEQLKTSRPGTTIEVTFSPSGSASVCPVAALNESMPRSAALRFRNGIFASNYKLCLSFIRPYNPVSPRTIAGWIVSVLQSAGIDTSIIKAHSVRGATSSHAYVSGIPVSQTSLRWQIGLVISQVLFEKY